MRMAHRLVNHGPQALDILTAGSWTYVYNKTNVTWNTAVQSNPVYGYTALAPTLESDGNHLFTTQWQRTSVAVAHSNGLVDISKFNKIRVKYKTWVNAAANRCHIELQPSNVTDYRPVASDIDIVSASTTTPGEIVFVIPKEAKNVPMRRVWIKALRIDTDSAYSELSITSITFE